MKLATRDESTQSGRKGVVPMISHKGLYKSLKCMIEWTKQCQDRLREEGFEAHLSPKQWAKEFCSVKFCISRQSGHTTFAEKLIEEVGLEALYITSNDSIAKYTKVPSFNRATPASIERGKFKGRRINTLIIDCASLMSQKDIEKVYDAFAPSSIVEPYFLFLFLE